MPLIKTQEKYCSEPTWRPSLPCPQDEDNHLAPLRLLPETLIKQDLGRTSVVSASSLNEKKETCSTMLFLSLQI